MISHRVSQELSLPRVGDRTFLGVHLKFQLRLKKVTNGGEHSLPGRSTTDIDVAVIGVPTKPEASTGKLFVQVCEQHVAEQRAEWSALGRSLRPCRHGAVSQNTRFQIAAN